MYLEIEKEIEESEPWRRRSCMEGRGKEGGEACWWVVVVVMRCQWKLFGELERICHVHIVFFVRICGGERNKRVRDFYEILVCK